MSSQDPFKLEITNLTESFFAHNKINNHESDKKLKPSKDLGDLNRSSYDRKKYEQILSKISYLDLEKPLEERKYNYSYEGILPYVFFFKYLARKTDENNFGSDSLYTRLKLWLPDTIVLNEKNDLPPMWFYTSEDGYVYRTDTFSMKNIVSKLSNYASPEELVAVLKKVYLFFILNYFTSKPAFYGGELQGNDVKLLSAKELSITLLNAYANRQGKSLNS